MSRVRLNVFLDREHAKRLDELATLKRMSKSGIVAAALASYLSRDGGDRREAILTSRLDRFAHVFERLERDQTILIETLALFIRHELAVTTPVADAYQDAARVQGRARFEQFTEQLVRHLLRGGSLVKDVWTEIAPEARRPVSVAGNTAPSPEGSSL
ncbi:MAG: CopG family transcriptional regulator [Gammaproteobacteria bacterium]